MAYVKHNWIPAEVISEALLDHLETQYDEAASDLAIHEGDGTVHHKIATGSYTGNGADDRQITVGFKCSMVIVIEDTTATQWTVLQGIGMNHHASGVFHTTYLNQEDQILLHATDGFIVDDGTAGSANVNTRTYYYWAISE